MEIVKHHINVKLNDRVSVPAVLRDYGDHLEITPSKAIFLDHDRCKIIQDGKAVPDDDPNRVNLTLPAIRYKLPRNIRELDLAQHHEVMAQLWFEKVQKITGYYFIGIHESMKRDGNPEGMVDLDAVTKVLEEMKMPLMEEMKMRKMQGDQRRFADGELCEIIKMKLKMKSRISRDVVIHLI